MDLNLPHYFNAADYFIDRHLREGRADKNAIHCQDRTLTYGEVALGVNRMGNALKSASVRMEERVALMLLDTEVFPQAFFGAIKIGAVPVCMNTLLRPKDYLYQLNDCRARLVLIDASLVPLFEEVRAELLFVEKVIVVGGSAPEYALTLAEFLSGQQEALTAAPTTNDDACFWLYSSGSTGSPKGTVHLQHDMVFSAETYGKKVLGVRTDDVLFSAAKLFFAYGLGNGLYLPFSVGATTVLMPERPTPEAVYQTIEKNRPTLFFGVPTLYGQMLENHGSMMGARLCVSAGEALPADILKRWRDRFGVDICDGIGSTEMCHIFISNIPGSIRAGATGYVVPGYEAAIVDENMTPVKNGEIGTLVVKGDSAAPFYWNQHDRSKKTMIGEWLNTGDKFYREDDGCYFYAGRTDDMLKVGGIWVSPVEVEASIIEHPAVLECAVVGDTDDDDLVKPKAYVVVSSGITASPELAAEIKQHVKKSLAHYKFPRWVQFVDSLPKTATGKIQRFRLRELDKLS